MRGLVLWFGVVMCILGRELLFRLLDLFIRVAFYWWILPSLVGMDPSMEGRIFHG